jgi:hypothetical protein
MPPARRAPYVVGTTVATHEVANGPNARSVPRLPEVFGGDIGLRPQNLVRPEGHGAARVLSAGDAGGHAPGGWVDTEQAQWLARLRADFIEPVDPAGRARDHARRGAGRADRALRGEGTQPGDGSPGRRGADPARSPAAHSDAELHIDPPDLANRWQAAGASALAFTLGVLLPLVAIVLPPTAWRVPVCVRAVLRVVAAGTLGLARTYVIGRLFGTALS